MEASSDRYVSLMVDEQNLHRQIVHSGTGSAGEARHE